MNNDLISRSALLEKAEYTDNYRLIVPVDCIEKAPAVDAETVIKSLPYVKEALEMAKQSLAPVVRCKNCRYIRPEVDAFTHEVVGHWCSLLDIGSVEYDHFCSYGEAEG